MRCWSRKTGKSRRVISRFWASGYWRLAFLGPWIWAARWFEACFFCGLASLRVSVVDYDVFGGVDVFLLLPTLGYRKRGLRVERALFASRLVPRGIWSFFKGLWLLLLSGMWTGLVTVLLVLRAGILHFQILILVFCYIYIRILHLPPL